MAGSNKNSPSYKDVVSFKWSDEILDEGFVPFPKRLLRCAGQVFVGDLRLSELRVVLAIVDYARPQVSRPPSLLHLAQLAGLTEIKFKKCLKTLRARKLIDWTGTEDRMTFDYDGLRDAIVSITGKIDGGETMQD